MSRRTPGLICAALWMPAVFAAAPQIWFCPMDPLLRPEVGYGGSPEYMTLFTKSAPWTMAAFRVNVFKIYPQWIGQATDADLQVQFTDLNRRGIALALEYGALTASPACGSGVEGFGGQTLLSAAQRIQRNGGKLRYVAMDEPIFFSTLYTGKNACKWTVDQMAANAAANLRALWSQFPDVLVGDIEPFPVSAPNWRTQYEAGVEAFRLALGKPLAFFHSDLPWSAPTYLADLASIRGMADAAGVPFGVIYNGNPSDASDAAWVQAAARNMYSVESNLGTPDQVIFQSWHPYPKKLLPETDADSFTWLIDAYFRRRTSLTSTVSGGAVRGQLVAADTRQPIAGAPVEVTATETRGPGVPAVYTTSGDIPAGTQRIVLGARVNIECNCSGAADVVLSSLAVESGGGTIARDFSNGTAGWGMNAAGGATAKVESGGLHIVTDPAGSVLLNSAAVPFSATGAYTFLVNARVAPKSAGSGYFTLVFLGATAELARVRLPIAAPTTTIAKLVTDAAGRFTVPLPAGATGSLRIQASYPGDTDFWPAESTAIRTGRPRR